MSGLLDRGRLQEIVDEAGHLVARDGPDAVLDWILVAARELTGARYAALGVLNRQRSSLEHFHATGIGEGVRRAIGAQPRGRGVLGTLILEPSPLRLGDVGGHPSVYGFPDAHPVMRGFLGVPISFRGEVWGNLYLAQACHGSFSEQDEEVAVTLAGVAASAVELSRQPHTQERNGDQ